MLTTCRRRARRFPGGGQYRVEIPSVEGPEAFAAVVEAAAEHSVPVHRISACVSEDLHGYRSRTDDMGPGESQGGPEVGICSAYRHVTL
jgi:hypothetical protein